MKIQILNQQKNIWELCAYNSWEEIIADGFVFIAQTEEGHILMRHNGYLEIFRNFDDSPKERKLIKIDITNEHPQEIQALGTYLDSQHWLWLFSEEKQ